MDFLDDYAAKAPGLLRLALASVFLFHGIQKLVASGPYDMMVGKMGMPGPVFWLVTLAEVAGGALILFGGLINSLATRLGALAIIPVMIGAIVMVHAQNGWSFMNNGMEFQVVLLLVALYFLIAGNTAPGHSGT